MNAAHHLRAADRADADRHADLDLARPHRAHLPVHDDAGADRVGGAEAVHRHREVRDHGDPVLHPRRQLPHPRRRGAADDRTSPPSMVGHWHGGLGLAGVLACALFAAVSGSSPATVVAIGSIILPAMVKQGFPKRFGAGVITTSGALGILIPPSIVMVIYVTAAWLDRTRSARSAAVHRRRRARARARRRCSALTTWYRARKNDYPRMPKASWGERCDGVPRSDLGPAADRHRASAASTAASSRRPKPRR